MRWNLQARPPPSDPQRHFRCQSHVYGELRVGTSQFAVLALMSQGRYGFHRTRNVGAVLPETFDFPTIASRVVGSQLKGRHMPVENVRWPYLQVQSHLRRVHGVWTVIRSYVRRYPGCRTRFPHPHIRRAFGYA